MFGKKALLMIVLLLSIAAITQAQEIIFLSYNPGDTSKIDPVTGESPDMPHIYALEDAGYTVTVMYTELQEGVGQDTLDLLENADLIILGRSTPSIPYGDNKLAWNSITTPTICLEMWALRNSRLNWFNSGSVIAVGDSGVAYNATIIEQDDPVFGDLDTGNPIPWMIGTYDQLEITDGGNATVLARSADDNNIVFARFAPDEEFYGGSVDAPWGWRCFIGNGRDASGLPPFNYYNFTPESEQVFLAEVLNMLKLGGWEPSAIDEQGKTGTPQAYELFQNYPNPFNPTTNIGFRLQKQSDVTIELVNILGEVVKVITKGTFNAGINVVQLNAADLTSGVYFYTIKAGDFTSTRKLMLLK